ncbi:MAG: ABC transporter ATP-binding protein [Phycisphaerae bacterium]|nr:ABC transporter ATP-binding protein [Phycisphaerae bacterium]
MATTDGPPVVLTAGLTKVFRDFWYRSRVRAIDGLDLEIRSGEVFGLLGPNGSGKSTTIKILLGLLYPTRGRVAVFTRPPTDVVVKERIGYLPEESYLYRFLNARETLDYYGRLFHLARPDRRRRVEELLHMVGLEREARRCVGEYSKGMARRIGLAQALINDPDLLILDEPTTGLDPIGTAQIKDLIRRLNVEHGKTILLSSHLLGDVEDVCHRVCILYGGRQQALGGVNELLSRTELTQITTERLAPATLDRIRTVVRESESKDILDISAPTDRLETFFVRIVREAEQQRATTSGASAGGALPGFFGEGRPSTAGEGHAVIESLVDAGRSADTPEPVAASAPAAPAEPAPQRNVIDSLVSQQAAGPPEAGPVDAAAPPRRTEEPAKVDESVIESLLDKDNRED